MASIAAPRESTTSLHLNGKRSNEIGTSSPAKRQKESINDDSATLVEERENGILGKKRIFINAFDMFTVGHLSFGQWRNPKDASATKRRDLSYWTNLAKLLEEGDISALFLADTFGQYDVYKGSTEPGFSAGAQYPMGDPSIVSNR